MKNVVVVPVTALKVQDGRVNKAGKERPAILLLSQVLPKAGKQADVTAIELSPKQMDNLCAMHGGLIRARGITGWLDLATYAVPLETQAVISCETHKKGDKYVDTATGEEKTREDDVVTYSVDNIVIPSVIRTDAIRETIKRNTQYGDTLKSLKDMVDNAKQKTLVETE